MSPLFKQLKPERPGLLWLKNKATWAVIALLFLLVIASITSTPVSAAVNVTPNCQPEMLCTAINQGQLVWYSPQLVSVDTTLVQTGPGPDYFSYGDLPLGAISLVSGVSQDGNWWAIPLPTSITPDGLGWVNAKTVAVKNIQPMPGWLQHCDRITYCGYVLSHSPQYVPVMEPSSSAPRFGMSQP